ncbi:hypothetical protein XCR1_1060063 [Xenorhabdus cabanillasii JM26]|uniref:Uncharacterized protein n=1 Tax=Xenorhabdus cabanillasii JM26 TaxID=1427517 RepID=W1IL22_9GAMM|nr:hypothetical protein XCR1_1060063 [Xenorhabdus cabanillasii JM26]
MTLGQQKTQTSYNRKHEFNVEVLHYPLYSPLQKRPTEKSAKI